MASAYHPQSNGQNECTNQTFKRALSKYTNNEMNDWDRFDSLYSFNLFSLNVYFYLLLLLFLMILLVTHLQLLMG